MTRLHTWRRRGRMIALLGLAGLASCASAPDSAQLDADFAAMLQAGFRAEGIAGLERLQQDPEQALCSALSARGGTLEPAQRERIEAAAQAGIRQPADGRYLGDWREGEKLAQSGRGLTWTDKSAAPAGNGGSCYNCHQISPAEISHGTIGPSLAAYGRLRGITDPADPAQAAIVRYTWGKLNNAWASNACSNMPRFGHRGILDETQLKHLMALLLDPASPVNAR